MAAKIKMTVSPTKLVYHSDDDRVSRKPMRAYHPWESAEELAALSLRTGASTYQQNKAPTTAAPYTTSTGQYLDTTNV